MFYLNLKINLKKSLIDFQNPFKGDSVVAFVGVVASFCAVLILLIFRMSKKIVEKMNDNA